VSIHAGDACARSQRPQPHLAPAVFTIC
jgi:hypothetical protein